MADHTIGCASWEAYEPEEGIPTIGCNDFFPAYEPLKDVEKTVARKKGIIFPQKQGSVYSTSNVGYQPYIHLTKKRITIGGAYE